MSFNLWRKKAEETMAQANELHGTETPLDAAYSTRSRASLVREAQLRAEIQRIKAMKAAEERTLERLGADAKRLQDADISTAGASIIHENLIQKRIEIGAHRETLAGYEEATREREQAVAKLYPSVAEIELRAEVQRKAAAIVCARAEIDSKIDAAVRQLRQLVADRAQQTAALTEAVKPLELALPSDGLDSERFEALAGSLPEDVGARSDYWVGHFLGKPKGGKPYVVRCEHLAVAETLAHNGIYKFGEVIVLADGEAQELLANDYAAPTQRAPWPRLWPRIMTPEAFERVKTVAEQRKLAPIETVFAEDLAQDRADHDFYKRGGGPPARKRQRAAPENAVRFETGLRIKVKVTGNISGPELGEFHSPGDLMEFTIADAWNMADEGAITAP